MATVFSIGDTFLLFDTINKCNDILKSKDDSPSYLPCRLAATVVVGTMYQVLKEIIFSFKIEKKNLKDNICSFKSKIFAETWSDDGQVV